MTEFLTEQEATEITANYMSKEGKTSSTQEILDSGAVPRLEGYKARPGKVSDSIFGGKFTHKGTEYENPPLTDKNGTPLRIMVRTDRISTHDINRGTIPFKDQILALNHNTMRKLVRGAMGTSQYDVQGLQDNSVVIAAENLQQIAVEMVIRAYMAKTTTSTSLYQAYVVRGERTFAGHKLPEGLVANGKLPHVIDTPSTKEETHDQTITPEWLYEHKICTEAQYNEMLSAALEGFNIAGSFYSEKGVILVDTKTEHGINRKGRIVTQDELYTMDSSRAWLRLDYNEQVEKFKRGEIPEINPKSFSKEFARGYSEGEKGYTDEQRALIAVRYITGIQNLLGQRFVPDLKPRDERVIAGLETVVRELVN